MSYYLGIDLGGTNIAVGVLDENYRFLSKHSVPTERGRAADEIVRDMAENDYEYWLLVATETDEDGIEKSVVGFTGGHNEPETNRFFISKIYLFPEARGHGYARCVIEFYEDLCFARGFEAMYLTVNKHNDLGIRAYEGTGFDTIDAVETDIGEGFIMDDFIMEKKLA